MLKNFLESCRYYSKITGLILKSTLLLKAAPISCVALVFLSCSSWEEVAAPDEFKPLKIRKYNDTPYVFDNYQNEFSKDVTLEFINNYFRNNCFSDIKLLSDSDFCKLQFLSYDKRNYYWSYTDGLHKQHPDTLLTVELNVDESNSIISS